MRFLITGFGPFHRWRTNPTEPLVAALLARPPGGIHLEGSILPVSYRRAPEEVIRRLRQGGLEGVLHFGLAPSPAALRLERVAVNLGDATIPDGDGETLLDHPLEPNGPAALLPPIPIRPALAALTQAGIPAVRSLSAGAYVCNALYYRVGRWISQNAPELPYGFVHIPPTEPECPEAEAILPAETIYEGARIILEVWRERLVNQTRAGKYGGEAL